MRSLLLCALLAAALAAAEGGDDGAGDAPELTAAQRARAVELMAQLSAEDRLAEEVAPPPKDDGLSKDDRLLLQAMEFDLMEAERWLERRDPAFAGEAFLRYHKQRKAIDAEVEQRLMAHLQRFDKRQLALARRLMRELPAADDDATVATGDAAHAGSGQDVAGSAADAPATTADQPPAAVEAAAGEASQSK